MVATSPVTAFANGGAFTNNLYNSPQLFKFADGGQFKTGMLGEAGPEAVMPLHRGSDGSLGVKVAGSQAESNVVVSVQVNIDAGGNSDVQTNGQGMGKGIGDLIGAKVRETILTEQRPGGMLNRSR
jgi:lambda family phage tail tape measure protein